MDPHNENQNLRPDLFSININWYSGKGIESRISPCGRMMVEVKKDHDDSMVYYEILIDSIWETIATRREYYYDGSFDKNTIDGPWIPDFINWLNSVKKKQDEYLLKEEKKEEELLLQEKLKEEQRILTMGQKWNESKNV